MAGENPENGRRQTCEENRRDNVQDQKACRPDHGIKKKKRKDEDGDEDEGSVKRKKTHNHINSTVRCIGGSKMSVQASRDHFYTSRQDAGPYTHVEVTYPNRLEEKLLSYVDDVNPIVGL